MLPLDHLVEIARLHNDISAPMHRISNPTSQGGIIAWFDFVHEKQIFDCSSIVSNAHIPLSSLNDADCNSKRAFGDLSPSQRLVVLDTDTNCTAKS